MIYFLCLGLFLPLAGFLVLTALYKIFSRTMAGTIACTTVFLSFLSFIALLVMHLQNNMESVQYALFSFVPMKGIQADFTLHVDSLSLLMTLIITGIGFLIHVYSIGYMDHDADFVRYFGFMNFFIFCMLLLVLAGHLLVLFLGWEGVGLASYFLIGYYYTKPEAARAATKAFVVNRIGDLGFLLGLLLTFYLFGTGDMAEISARAGNEFAVGAPIITILTLLYFIGATGKSAQLPLYTWLPDAMEGPTPVSALIHAATMVTAGVYLLVRMHDVFVLSPITMQIVGIVGGVTSLFAALCALGQTDLKRVLAFSTVSQLGLMFLACGAGAFYSAMFHLTMHAFVKALLFLSAGNVVHMLNGTTEMAKMGGLAKFFPKTNIFFLIGALALSGVPPLAAFFSKDLILEQEFLSGHEFLFILGLAASILTGVYMIRAYCLTFLGEQKLDLNQAITLREAPNVMLVPVGILSVLAVVGGMLGYSFGGGPLLEVFLSEIGVTPTEDALRSGFVLTTETWIAIAGALLGVGLTGWVYTKHADKLGETIAMLKNQFYVNEIYYWIFVKPLKSLAYLIAQVLEPGFFDGMIEVVVNGVEKVSMSLQRVQSGQIRSYMAWIVLGSVLLLGYFAL